MAGYRRFVAYVYEYVKGKKGTNCGFIKVEVKEQRCRLELHLRCPGIPEQGEGKVYGFVRNSGLMDGYLLGSCKTEEGSMQCMVETDEQNMGNSGIALGRMGGLILETDGGAFFGTEWDDIPIRPENFRKVRQSAERNAEEQKSEKKPNVMQEKERSQVTEEADKMEPERAEETEQANAPGPEKAETAESGNDPEQEEQPEREEQQEESEENIPDKEELRPELVSQSVSGAENAEAINEMFQQEDAGMDGLQKDEQPMPPETLNAQRSMRPGMPDTQRPMPPEMPDTQRPEPPEMPDTQRPEPPEMPNTRHSMPPEMSGRQNPMPSEMQNRTPSAAPRNPRPKSSGRPARERPGEIFQPFEDEEITDCRKVHIKDLSHLNRRDMPLRNNRFLQYGYYNFGHLLICCRADGRYILGVPGGYDQQERFMANMFGFPYFKESRHIQVPQGRGGYWYRLINTPDFH